MAKTMFWRLVPGVVHAVVHRKENPGDAEWLEYLESIVPHARTIKGLLVYTEHAGPSTQQRSRATSQWQRLGHTPKMAVMTKDRIVRGIVTALGWVLGSNIKAFPTTDFAGATASLGLTEEERKQAKEALVQLAAEANVVLEAFPK